MTKITVLQKDSDRYTFIFDDSRPEDTNLCTCGRHRISHEHMMTFGAGQTTENTTKERGNAFYKELIQKGFHRFRKLSEVSWYATRENNTPYEETWITEGIYLVPIASRVLD